MFNKALKQELQACEEELKTLRGLVGAIKRNTACIEFEPDGRIREVNEHFLRMTGYSRAEVIGVHHANMCLSHYAASAEYQTFWHELRQGKTHRGQFERVNKYGDIIWLEATYFPIEEGGVVTGVMKIASDVTDEKNKLQSREYVLNALDKSLAIIEFTPDGTILNANQNFTQAVGYNLSDIQGRHHKMFCDDSFYQENPTFWEELARGVHKSGQFARRNSYGDELWLEATYNPIIDDEGKVVKVIKFATDITQKVRQNQEVSQAANIAYSTSVQTAQIAKQGAELLSSSVGISSEIADSVSRTREQIGHLNDKSMSIQSIVSTIKEIADQTNLLALNAAIEAARAGEQGRGFAVVADEVRQLASRTSDSTTEIEAVVSDNRDLTAEVNQSMSQVAERAESGKLQITQVSSVMDEIHAGAENVSRSAANLAS